MKDEDVVGKIREKTEEMDLDHVLKSAMGGYSKKSVADYIALLRKQQQSIAETFNQNLQKVLAEKEIVKKENDSLLARLEQMEHSYQALKAAMSAYQLEEGEYSLEDVMQLKTIIERLQGEKEEKETQITLQHQAAENLRMEIEDRNRKAELLEQEIRQLETALSQARLDVRDQHVKAGQMSNTIVTLQDKIRFLEAEVSEGRMNDLTLSLERSMALVGQYEETVRLKCLETEALLQERDTLAAQGDVLREQMARLEMSFAQLGEQSQRQETAIATLNQRLQEEVAKSLELLRQYAEIKVDKLILERKLERKGLNAALEALSGENAVTHKKE